MGEHLAGRGGGAQREAVTGAHTTSITLGLALPNLSASPPAMFPKGWWLREDVWSK